MPRLRMSRMIWYVGLHRLNIQKLKSYVFIYRIHIIVGLHIKMGEQEGMGYFGIRRGERAMGTDSIVKGKGAGSSRF